MGLVAGGPVLPLILVALLTPTSPCVAVATPGALGFGAASVGTLQASVRAAAVAAVSDEGPVVAVIDAVPAVCVEDPACLGPRVSGHDALVVVEASRVGAEVEIAAVVYGSRRGSVARPWGFGRPTHRPPAPARSASPSSSVLATGAGAARGLAGLLGFALDAGTLDNPRSPGRRQGARPRDRVVVLRRRRRRVDRQPENPVVDPAGGRP
ncbi:MAG: hypothetical protein FJ137_16130 [Deltaproteobacteria bacterium]|nr:hypothetical protein [Deltaproteobacteria bacterium]